MATKKKVEVEATEVVEEVKEEVVEAPVEEAPKKASKKAEVVEEVKEEAPVSKPAPVVEKVPEVKEAPKKEKTTVAPVATSNSFEAVVTSAAGTYTFKTPVLGGPKGKLLAKGAKVVVSEVSGNWGKIGDTSWILLSCVAKI